MLLIIIILAASLIAVAVWANDCPQCSVRSNIYPLLALLLIPVSLDAVGLISSYLASISLLIVAVLLTVWSLRLLVTVESARCPVKTDEQESSQRL